MKSNAKLTAPTLRKDGSLDTRQKRESLSLCSLHPLHDSVASHISSQQADMMKSQRYGSVRDHCTRAVHAIGSLNLERRRLCLVAF